jgi:hypothetical protein
MKTFLKIYAATTRRIPNSDALSHLLRQNARGNDFILPGVTREYHAQA